MNTAPFRDPRAPGAPILPQPGWHLPPYNRWTFLHMREMTPTATVRRGRMAPRDFERDEQDLGDVAFTSRGRDWTVDSWLDDSWTDGFLLLHRGKIVTERYMGGLKPHHQHLSMSVAKSVLGIVAGVLIHRGVIAPDADLTTYLPELEATGYRDVTVQQALDMTSGVTFDEAYETPGSHMQKLGNACAWGGRGDLPGWPQTIWQLVLELTETERPHGEKFVYRSIETDVLGFAVERATGQPLAEILSDVLWQKLGVEEDAAYTVDHGGFALADGGLNATLRDYGRFAQMLLDGGRVGDTQVVPEAWIRETRFGAGGLFEGIYAEVLPGGGYHNKFWQADRDRGVISARGIYGQCIYIDPESQFAAVKLSTRETPLDMDSDMAGYAAYKALAGALTAS
ncbi:serine hydrolase domain-containing protein [Chachezhania antarctica]|uniref:serine hydrolase domain-containing protein n=1 Tax=Chachezhania antarctica TaxID=2340860 RepID=UPI000EB11118|nr:serine hydrolase [Chachezhania antarctica]|tara:strand:+ start:1702 stop:2892 length:1191 start_codon:yes stop_codon:yes gene_type:complete